MEGPLLCVAHKSVKRRSDTTSSGFHFLQLLARSLPSLCPSIRTQCTKYKALTNGSVYKKAHYKGQEWKHRRSKCSGEHPFVQRIWSCLEALSFHFCSVSFFISNIHCLLRCWCMYVFCKVQQYRQYGGALLLHILLGIHRGVRLENKTRNITVSKQCLFITSRTKPNFLSGQVSMGKILRLRPKVIKSNVQNNAFHISEICESFRSDLKTCKHK